MSKRYTQPQESVDIDWANPLTRGLADAFLPHQMATSSVLGRRPIVTAPVALSYGKYGLGASATTNSIRYDVGEWSEGGVYSVLAITTINSFGATGSFIRKDGAFAPAQIANNTLRCVPWSPVDGDFNYFSGQPVPKNSINVAVRKSISSIDLYVDGKKTNSKTNLSGYGSTSNPLCLLGTETGGELITPSVGKVYLIVAWNRALTEEEVVQITNNPWQIFKGVINPAFLPQGFGPVDHVTEGSPEGPGADTTGSASHRPTSVVHQTGGSAKGFQASVTGVAERDRFHNSGGSVEGFTSTVTGASARYRVHPVTGAVVADYATVTGASESSSPAGVHECEGIVTASEAIVVGTALNFSKLTSSGAVKGYQSTVTGAAKNVKKHSTNGAPIGKSSQVIGTAARLDPLVDHGTFGEVDGYQSSVTGNAVNQGSMTLTPADIAAIVAALQAAILPVNIVRVNSIDVDGTGTGNDPWGPV